MTDRLADIKARWFTDEMHHPNWWADHASRDIPTLVGEVERLDYLTLVAARDIERLRGLLARLEWEGGLDGAGVCPACHNYDTGGHDPDCWLANELPRQ